MATPQFILDEMARRREIATTVYDHLVCYAPDLMALQSRDSYIERFLETLPPLIWTDSGT
jgi:hypothetical protein